MHHILVNKFTSCGFPSFVSVISQDIGFSNRAVLYYPKNFQVCTIRTHVFSSFSLCSCHICLFSWQFEGRLMTLSMSVILVTLPSGDDPHDSGPIQWARGDVGLKPSVAARPNSGVLRVARGGFGLKPFRLPRARVAIFLCKSNLITRNLAPGGFLCCVVSKPRTWRKRTPLEELPPKLINLAIVLQGGSSSSGFLVWKQPNKETPPVCFFFRSNWDIASDSN